MNDSSETLFTQVNATLVGLILYLCLLDVWDVNDSSKTLFTQVNATLVGLILYLLYVCWMFRMWTIQVRPCL